MSNENPFNCIDAATLVCESRDRKLSLDELSHIGKHVSGCPECQVAKRQLSDLFKLLDDLLERTGASDTE